MLPGILILTLLYIRGLTEKDLKNVIAFLYNGEVEVAHDELEKFLDVAIGPET